MNRFILPALVLIITGVVGACQRPDTYGHAETIAGVDYSLTIYGHSRKQSDRAIEAVFAELRLLAGYNDPVQGKPLARTNVLLRGGEWFSVNPSVTQILKHSIRYHELTGGLYNPAVLGALKERYGLYEDAKKITPPNERELQNFLASPPTMKDVNFDGIRLQGTHPGIRLDFDFLAYGYAIDIQLQHLHELGIRNAVLQIGNVRRAIGPRAMLEQPINFRHSKPPAGAPVSGSAFCERSTENGNAIVMHPVTGQPVSTVRSVQLVAQSASDASVACWVLLASPVDQWQQMAARINLVAAVLETGDDQYHVWSNAAQ